MAIYQLRGQYNPFSAEEQAQIQAAGNAAFEAYKKSAGSAWDNLSSGYQASAPQVGQEAAERAAGAISTQISNRISEQQVQQAAAMNTFIAQNPNASSLPTSIDPTGQYAVVNGVLTQKSAITAKAKEEADYAAGLTTRVKVGSGWAYIPKGSSADILQQGIASGQVGAGAGGQQQGQFLQQQGFQPTMPPITQSQGLSPQQLTQQIQQQGVQGGQFSLTGGNLTVGSSGTNVSQLQTLLNKLGAKLNVDGKYGPLTKQAVMDFQKRAGIRVDGIVGQETTAALNRMGGGGIGEGVQGGIGGGVSEGVGTSEIARTEEQERIDKMKKELEGLEAPKLFKASVEYERLRREQGIVEDENELNSIRNEARLAKEEMRIFQSRAGKEVSEGGRIGAVTETERNMSFRLEGLAIREQAVMGRLNTKNAFIKTALDLGQDDYNTALKAYETEYNSKVKAIDEYNKELRAEQKDALTGFTTITNLLTKAGVRTIDSALSQQLDTMALKAGLPAGVFQTALTGLSAKKQNVDNMKIVGKNLYMWTTGADGIPHLQFVQALKGTGPTGSPTNFSSSDVSEGQRILNNAKGPDGYTDPNLYRRMYDEWVTGGGAPNAFIKAYPPIAYINPVRQDIPLPSILRTGLPKLDTGSSNPYD